MPPLQRDFFNHGTTSGLKVPYSTSPFELLQEVPNSSNLFVAAPETNFANPTLWNMPETTPQASTSTVPPSMSHFASQQQPQPVFENAECYPYATVKFNSVADDVLQQLHQLQMTTPPLQPQAAPSEAPMSVNRLHTGRRSDSVDSMASITSNSTSNSPGLSPMLTSAVATAAAHASPRSKHKSSISKQNKTASNNPSSPRRRNSNSSTGNRSPRRGGERLPANETKFCTNCFTGQTPMWRRSQVDNSLLCNRCGLFFTRHNSHRLIEEAEKRANMTATALPSPSFVASATPRSLVSDGSFDSISPRTQNTLQSDEELEDFELNDDDGPFDASFLTNSFPSSSETTPRDNQKLIVNRLQQQQPQQQQQQQQPQTAAPFQALPPSLLQIVPMSQPGWATISLNPNDQQNIDLLIRMVHLVAQQNQYH